jgi:hypothetical protein
LTGVLRERKARGKGMWKVLLVEDIAPRWVLGWLLVGVGMVEGERGMD